MGDRAIWVVYFFLCAISLVEVFSAGSALAYKSGSFLSPLLKQAFFIAFGTLVLWLLHRVPCRVFKVLPIFLWPVSVALLLITLLFAEKTNDGSRWMDIGLFRFQPSEVAKLTVVVAVALILSRMQRENGADRRALKYLSLIHI